MKIAGLQKLSLVDFPEHLSSIVFLQGCNFFCGYCHNPDLVTFDTDFGLTEENILKDIKKNRKVIDGVVVSGGEPTIYATLPEFLKKIKEMELKVKLDTNGTNPDQLDFLFRSWILDYIAIDIKTSFDKYHFVTNQKDVEEKVSASIRLAMLSNFPYEFRTTCVPGLVDEEVFETIGKRIKGAKKYCLQQFRPMNTLDKKFENILPFLKEELYKFKSILEKYVEKVEIRGI